MSSAFSTGITMSKPDLQLIGEDGNAFAILGRARHAANTAGWDKAKIDKVMETAMAGDYNHLLRTMIENFNTDGDEENT